MPSASSQTNGLDERFILTLKDEFFSLPLRQKFDVSVADLRINLDAWLVRYNMEQPHYGYRNMNRRRIDTVNLFQEAVKTEGWS